MLNEEQTDLQSLVNMLKRDCKPYINAIKSCRGFLYRGYSSTTSLSNWGEGPIYFRKTTRMDRKPKDMYPGTHDKLNKLFYKKFGWKPRSEGVFCTSDRGTTSGYGDTFFLFPIGTFKYVWSPEIEDLWTHIKSHISQRVGKSKVPDIKAIVDSYTDKDIAKAIDSGYEVSIKCKEYYIVYFYSIFNYGVDEFREMLIK
jgi:hypothetical protein